MESLEKLGYYKVSKQNSLIESIPVGITKGKDQLVGYGTIEDDFQSKYGCLQTSRRF
jgi:hypothetical protein